jgi:hypothetical protein
VAKGRKPISPHGDQRDHALTFNLIGQRKKRLDDGQKRIDSQKRIDDSQCPRPLDRGRRKLRPPNGLAGTLIAIAAECRVLRASAVTIIELKKLRATLRFLPTGLTDKNKALLPWSTSLPACGL